MRNEEKDLKKEELTDKEIETVSGGGARKPQKLPEEYAVSLEMEADIKTPVAEPQKFTERKCACSTCTTMFTPRYEGDIYCSVHSILHAKGKI